MKRDMDLVRRILLEVEERGFEEVKANSFEAEGYDTFTVAAHLQLLKEAGLLEASILVLERAGAVEGYAQRLTWEGHDYLDAVRNQEIWEKTKAHLSKHAGSIPFEMIKAVAIGYIRQRLGLPD